MANPERMQQLKEILAQDPANVLARYALGMELSGAGEVDAAVAEFETLVGKNPDYANAYFMAAQALAGAERKDEARAWLQRGLQAAQRSGNQHAASEMQGMLDELDF